MGVGTEGGRGWMDGWKEGGRCGGGVAMCEYSGSSLASMLRPALWQIATILEGAGSNELLGFPNNNGANRQKKKKKDTQTDGRR